MTIKQANEEIEKIRAELHAVGEIDKVPMPPKQEELKLTNVVLAVFFAIVLISIMILTYGRISGFVVLEENMSESNFSVEQNISNETAAEQAVPPSLIIKDSRGRDVRHSLDVLQENPAEDNYTVDITPSSSIVKKIKLRGAKANLTLVVGLEDIGTTEEWNQLYALDFSLANFTDGEFTATAKGNALFKCKDWDFLQSTCMGEWVKIQDMIPGTEYTVLVSPNDPGFGEQNISTYYLLNASDTQYASYRQMRNQTPPAQQVTSGTLSLSTTGVKCWTDKWIANNWTERVTVNGTWNFTTYGGCDSTTAVAYIFVRMLKVNASGEYNFANSTQSASNMCTAATTTSTISHVLPYSSYVDLAPGERIGAAYCINVTNVKNNKLAYMYWQGATPSNVRFPMTIWDDQPPTIFIIDYPDGKYKETPNITFRYTVSDINNITECSLAINNTLNQTNNSINKNAEQSFSLYDLPYADYNWSINCTDNQNNTAATTTRTVHIINATAPSVFITSPATNSQFMQGYDIPFTGVAYDYEDGNLSGFKMVWSSNKDGRLGFGTDILIATLTPGNHTITLTATDSLGLSSTSSINVTITPTLCTSDSQYTLLNITVDGNMTDWSAILSDPDNVINDGVSGITDPDVTQTADKDIRKYAFTWNEEWLWMYMRRSSGGSNVIGIDNYFDTNLNDRLNFTDRVLVTGWSGSNGKYETSLYNYSPSNVTGGDPVTGDGVDEPGGITNPIDLESNMPGGSEEGIEIEYRIRWSELNMTSCSPIVGHIATALGGGTNIPSQLEDNAAKWDTRSYRIKFYPNSTSSGKNGTSVLHWHTIRNTGNMPDIYNFNITGTLPGYTVALYFSNGTLITDTDGDGRVDTGYILPAYGYRIYANVTIPSAAISGDIDTTTIRAFSKYSNTTNATIVDTTIVGAIALVPNNIGFAVKGTTIDYLHKIYNNDITAIVNVQAASSQGYNVTLHYYNGTQLTDTNIDGKLDVGYIMEGFYTYLKVRIAVPASATIGTIDNTTVIANSTYGEYGRAYDKTTVSEKLSITPNITTAAGKGRTIYLTHTITYVSNESGVVDITYNQTQPFDISFYYSDYITPLTDTNSNSIIDAGTFGVNGVTKIILVKLVIPSDTPVNTTDIIYYNVTSSSNGGYGLARDNVTAQQIVVYEDSGFMNAQEYFSQTQTVYTQAYALNMANVYFQFIDPNATVRRTSPYIPVDMLQSADDNYYINDTELSGTWQVAVINKQGDVEIAMTHFYVNTPPVILSANDTPDPIYQGDIVNFTANITAGEKRWFENETVVLGALVEIGGINYSMTGPNTPTGIGLYYFDTLDTFNLAPGLYTYNIYGYDNFTFNNVSSAYTGTLLIKSYNTTNVSGTITDSRHNMVNSSIYVYNSTGHLVWTDDAEYFFELDRGDTYNITIIPENGSLKEITYIDVTFPPIILNFTRLEDTAEYETDKPYEIYNWTESIAWWTNPLFYFTQAKINFTYGEGTGLYFWKCADWNFDDRNCTDNNFQVIENLSDGPDWAVLYLSPGDPGAGAGKAPDYNESLKVWDVTGLNESERAYNGTFLGEYYDLESINFTIGKSYRFEIYVTQTITDTRGILRDPYYDNIQYDWVIDMEGIDSPNITQIHGSILIDPFVPTVDAGTEAGTLKLIWDSDPPNRTVSDMDENDTAMFWFVVDIPINSINETHPGHFLGKSKGHDAEITNNLTTLVGMPPYKVNLTYPNNGNNTLINRTITFIWEQGYDPDNQTLTYEINITSELCSDISDTNISATNYTPIYELGTYDECGTYNWSVRAYDGYFYGNWSDSWNFSIMPYLALQFLVDTVDFGDATNDETNDTADDLPPPLLILSDGNLFAKVINVTQNQSFFIGESVTDSDFQLKIDNSTEIDSFNWTGSATSWINVTTIMKLIDRLSWRDMNDTAEIDLKVHVPVDEPPGMKITGLVFYGAQS